MIISGSRSVKKSQKFLKKATNQTYSLSFKKNFVLANLIHINSYNMRKKSVMSLYKFRTYFFPLSEFETSFLNLLTRANNTRPCFFWLTFIKLYWGQSTKGLLGVVQWPFCVVKIKKKLPKIVTLSAPNVLDPLLRLNMHLIMTIDFL